MHGGDYVGGRPLVVGDVPGMARSEEPVEGLVVRRRVSRPDQGSRDMGAAPDSVAHVGADRVEVDREARLDELLRHSFAPSAPALLPLRQVRVEFGAPLVDEEGEYVDVLLARGVCRDLRSGYELDPPPASLLARPGQTSEGVVVGESERAHARLGHPGNELGRRVEPIGNVRMAVEIDAQAAILPFTARRVSEQPKAPPPFASRRVSAK
jgi:hypothetical protein